MSLENIHYLLHQRYQDFIIFSGILHYEKNILLRLKSRLLC